MRNIKKLCIAPVFLLSAAGVQGDTLTNTPTPIAANDSICLPHNIFSTRANAQTISKPVVQPLPPAHDPAPAAPVDPVEAAWARITTAKNSDLSAHSAYGKPIIVIDNGHGEPFGKGKNPGAVSTRHKGYYEVEAIDAVSTRLAQRLEKDGYHVFFTRAPHARYRYGFNSASAPDLLAGSRSEDVNRSLRSRAQLAYTLQHQLHSPYMVFMSIHADSDTASTPHPKIIVHNAPPPGMGDTSRRLGQDLQARYHISGLGRMEWQSRDLAILSEASLWQGRQPLRSSGLTRVSYNAPPPRSAALLFELGGISRLKAISPDLLAERLAEGLKTHIDREIPPAAAPVIIAENAPLQPEDPAPIG